MGIDPKHNKEIENIIAGLKCPKDFKCYKAGLKELCKAKDIGLILCLENDPQSCKFVLPFRGEYLCKCPLRIYIIKELKK